MSVITRAGNWFVSHPSVLAEKGLREGPQKPDATADCFEAGGLLPTLKLPRRSARLARCGSWMSGHAWLLTPVKASTPSLI